MKDTDEALTELLLNLDFNLPTTLSDGVYTAMMNSDDDTDSDSDDE